ncbi:MAG: 30S ribosomal protein S16, partial [Candidatus Pacebacteria bacterium]|nr:30S ribosomal protein S16 [Candidatus Paceibacterota bacterium]
LEVLGSFDARSHERQTVDAERVKHWIAQGAEPTDTMHNFLISQKIITGKKRNVLPKKSPIKKEEAAKAPEAPKAEAAPEAPKEEKKEEAKA